eukprot:m.164160 g.164160  ORF g.164160 m.164160 type:complete len:470 (-) comp13423_c0_seq1:444-1853(-)
MSANIFDNVEQEFAKSISNVNATLPRWQRKMMRASATNSSAIHSNQPSNPATPKKQNDRFIPQRANMDIQAASHNLMDNCNSNSKNNNNNGSSSSSVTDSKILSFKSAAPKPKHGFQSDLRVMYTQNNVVRKPKKVSRMIPQAPERVLDAPELHNDFYLNLLDWSVSNTVAIALDDTVYLWNASSGGITELCQLEGQDSYVSSLRWAGDGLHLAVGTSNATVQIFDVTKQRRLREMGGHQGRVGASDWNQHILTSGSASGLVLNSDVRMQDHIVQDYNDHTQEVCGVRWNAEGTMLATSGNDNMVHVYDEEGTHLHGLNDHMAAVKALAWCPWNNSLLATGGGTNDNHIRFYNAITSNLVNEIDTGSQVSGLLWNQEYKEIISSHGYSSVNGVSDKDNMLQIWKYPTMAKVADLRGHTDRVLGMALSPDGETVVSASGDETLRFWKVFQSDPLKKKNIAPPSALSNRIR